MILIFMKELHCEMHFFVLSRKHVIFATLRRNRDVNLGTEKYHVNPIETSSSLTLQLWMLPHRSPVYERREKKRMRERNNSFVPREWTRAS